MKKLNNKGFTLVELLAVLVILVAIMSIAIPSISSSLERSKGKQEESKHKILESAAELYVTDHRNSIKNSSCVITLETLLNENYIDEDAATDSDGNDLVLDQTCVKYEKDAEGKITYEYETGGCGNPCIDTP